MSCPGSPLAAQPAVGTDFEMCCDTVFGSVTVNEKALVVFRHSVL